MDVIGYGVKQSLPWAWGFIGGTGLASQRDMTKSFFMAGTSAISFGLCSPWLTSFCASSPMRHLYHHG